MVPKQVAREAMKKGRESMESLSPSEREIFHYRNMMLCWYYSSQHFQYQERAMGETDWAQSLGLIRTSRMAHRGSREWWRSFDRQRVSEPFYELVESEVRRIEAGT